MGYFEEYLTLFDKFKEFSEKVKEFLQKLKKFCYKLKDFFFEKLKVSPTLSWRSLPKSVQKKCLHASKYFLKEKSDFAASSTENLQNPDFNREVLVFR